MRQSVGSLLSQALKCRHTQKAPLAIKNCATQQVTIIRQAFNDLEKVAKQVRFLLNLLWARMLSLAKKMREPSMKQSPALRRAEVSRKVVKKKKKPPMHSITRKVPQIGITTFIMLSDSRYFTKKLTLQNAKLSSTSQITMYTPFRLITYSKLLRPYAASFPSEIKLTTQSRWPTRNESAPNSNSRSHRLLISRSMSPIEPKKRAAMMVLMQACVFLVGKSWMIMIQVGKGLAQRSTTMSQCSESPSMYSTEKTTKSTSCTMQAYRGQKGSPFCSYIFQQFQTQQIQLINQAVLTRIELKLYYQLQSIRQQLVLLLLLAAEQQLHPLQQLQPIQQITIMGASVDVSTPAFIESDWQYQPQSQEGLCHGYRTLLNPQSGLKIDQYELTWPSQQQFSHYLKSFNWRHRHPNVVNTCFIDLKNKHQLCAITIRAKVYLEHVFVRLSQINDIPYPDNLFVLLQALEGYAAVYEKTSYFEIQEDQICVDAEGNIKIWMNSDLSASFPNSFSQDANQQGQEVMVERLVQVIADNTDRASQPEVTFLQYFQENKTEAKKFQEAKALVLSYATQQGTQIPHAFQSVLTLLNENQLSGQESQNEQEVLSHRSTHKHEVAYMLDYGYPIESMPHPTIQLPHYARIQYPLKQPPCQLQLKTQQLHLQFQLPSRVDQRNRRQEETKSNLPTLEQELPKKEKVWESNPEKKPAEAQHHYPTQNFAQTLSIGHNSYQKQEETRQKQQIEQARKPAYPNQSISNQSNIAIAADFT